MRINKCKLGDLLYIKQGYAFKSERYVASSQYRLCTLGNFDSNNDFKFNDVKATYYPEDFPKEFLLNEGDLVLPLTEQTVGLFGNSAFIPHTDNFSFVQNQRVGKVVAKENADIVYLHYLLSTNLIRNQIEATSSGTKQRNTSPDKIYDVDVWVPNRENQEKIGDFLHKFELKKQNNTRICAEMELMAKTLYDYWFTQFDFPNTDGKPYRSSSGEMVWNDQLKREIPKGWAVKKLSDICTFRNGINYEKDCIGNYIYRIANVRNIIASSLIMDVSDFDEIFLPREQADRYVMKKDDIIIARSGTPGATRLIINPSDNVIFCGFIICCTPNDAKQRIFLAHFLKQLEGTNATRTGGSILQNVSQDTLKSLLVCLPNDYILDRFNEKIESIIGMIQNLIKENRELTKLRDWLLPMLMNGQATVE